MREIIVRNITMDDEDARSAYAEEFNGYTRISYRMETGIAIFDLANEGDFVVVSVPDDFDETTVTQSIGENFDIIFAVQWKGDTYYIAIDCSGDFVYSDLEQGSFNTEILNYITFEPGFDDEQPEDIEDFDEIIAFHGLV